MTKFKKGLYFSDIHWGRKSGSELHNNDCLNYIKWLCEIVRSRNDIEFIGFLGDWFENRSSINVSTLNYSYKGAKLLDSLGIPIYFCVGNHDLFHRNTRELHSLIHFHDLTNFHVLEHPTQINEIHDGVFFCPYVFQNEYPELPKLSKKSKVWAGHFEFKGFVITGTNVRMPSGPDIKDFTQPISILSGHFHKRQEQANVKYIGNTFPMDYGDIDDVNRGVAIYDHVSHTIEYLNWNDCPKYTKCTISELLDESKQLHQNSYVKCIMDVPTTYEELMIIKQTFTTQFNLREFITEEIATINESISETEVDNVEVGELTSIDDLIVGMLLKIENKQIDNELLVDIYKQL